MSNEMHSAGNRRILASGVVRGVLELYGERALRCRPDTARQVKAEATRMGITVNQHFIAQMLSAFGDEVRAMHPWAGLSG